MHIVPRLPVFLDQHPHLSLDLLLSDRPGDPIREGVDVSFRTGTLNDSSVVARKIATCRRLVVGTPAFFERSGVPETPSDLARLAAVLYAKEHPSGGDVCRFRQGELEIDVKLSGQLRVSAAEAVREAVLSGLGYAVASEWTFAPELAKRTVQAVLADWLLPPLDCWALFPAGRMTTAKARAFANFVQAELGRTKA
jgi:DNA-binding transcriptional LysR family regulator